MRAIGVSVHTGWGACVIVRSSMGEPEIIGSQVITLVDQADRFCFHRAAQMRRDRVPDWLARIRAGALETAHRALSPLLSGVEAGAIVAKDGLPPDLDSVLASHPRIHLAEGLFYRDIFRDACTVPCRIIPPRSLDTTAIGTLATRPWGRDQKMAALAAWMVLEPLGRDAR